MSWLRWSHKERWAEAAFWFGVLMLVAAMFLWTTGIAIAAFLPLPFSLAAAYLVRSKARIAQCLLILACWFIGLGFALA